MQYAIYIRCHKRNIHNILIRILTCTVDRVKPNVSLGEHTLWSEHLKSRRIPKEEKEETARSQSLHAVHKAPSLFINQDWPQIRLLK